MNYLKCNKEYWNKGYHAPNVDHIVFRFFGKILQPQFNLGGKFERLVDFGCGQGAAVNYFTMQGFNACGVDVSEVDINIAKARYPHIERKFSLCKPYPADNDYYGFSEEVSVVIAIQSLYYFSDTDFKLCMERLYDSMRSGGIFYATMMGEKNECYYNNSQPFGDDGLRVVNFKNTRISVSENYMSFVRDEEHLIDKFKMFKPLHVGYYAAKLRSDEGDGFHYSFCGIKE